MITRIVVTSAILLLGIYAFWGDALGGGPILNLPFGIIFVLLAAFIWFKWGSIRENFKSAKNESEIPIIRLNAPLIKGMFKRMDRRRSSSA
jgi:hypothetical protein